MSRHIATSVTSAIVATLLLTGAATGRSAGWGQQPPNNLTPPAISGTVQIGSSLTGSTGNWQRAASYGYQWLRCNSAGASCGAISGATSSTYPIASTDVGYTLRILVTATNKNGSAAEVSAVTQVVPSPTSTSPVPDTAITNVTCGTSVSAFPSTVCIDSNNDGGNSTTVTFTISNADGAECQMDDGSWAGTWAACTSGTVQFWVPLGRHTLYVRAKRSSDGARDASPAAASLTICPSSGCSSPPPPSSPAISPTNTAPPTVIGTAQQGQTLSASSGSWSGTTPINYAYQWQRCNSTGASCVSVSGATSSTDLLGSADVGSTMRVTVTASNSAGSASASSAATTVVSALTAPTPPLPSPTSLEANKSADDGYALLANWPNAYDPSAGCGSGCLGTDGNQPRYITDPTNSARRVAVLTTTPADDVGVPSTSQRVDLTDWSWQNAGGMMTQGREHWMRTEVYFPGTNGPGYYRFEPVAGEWNWVYQWHYNSTMNIGGFHTELEMGVLTDNPSRANPRWIIDIRGGDVGGQSDGPNWFRYTAPSNSLLRDHWYDLVFHVKWSHDGTGLWEIWIDGTKVVSRTQPNLYWRSSTGYNDILYPALSNYHAKAQYPGGPAVTWNTSILFRNWWAGATASSIGFTP